MGKNFCKVENKWCKFLKHDTCHFAMNDINSINRCPRLKLIETIRLSNLLKNVEFVDVFDSMIKWSPDQKSNEEAYKKVFNTLLDIKPKKHNLDDLFIKIDVVKDTNGSWLNVTGIDINSKRTYGIEFSKWADWVSMFIDQNTLDTLTYSQLPIPKGMGLPHYH